MSAWIWGLLAFLVFGSEMFALARSTDAYQPLTYYVRKLMKRPAIWAGVFGFWLWLGYHFFVQA